MSLEIIYSIIGLLIALAFAAFVIVSIILFINDGIKAKKERRCRNDKITVMFTVAIILAVVATALLTLLILLGIAIMRSM